VYYGLTYLQYQWLLKEHLNSMYGQVLAGLAKALPIFDSLRFEFKLLDFSSTSKKSQEEASFYSQLISQTQILVALRSDMVSLYRNLATTKKPPDYPALVSTLDGRQRLISKSFAHPYLAQLKSNSLAEVAMLSKLMQSQISISNFRFAESVCLLYQAKVDFDGWKIKFTSEKKKDKESQKQIKGGVHAWISKFWGTLVSKMSFYFYKSLQLQEKEQGGHISTQTSKLAIDYYSLTEQFIIKTACLNVSIIFQTNGVPISLDGYFLCSSPEPEHVTGLKSWPAIVSLPRDPPLEHWPNIISLIQDNSNKIEKQREPLFFQDNTVNSTYFICNIETRMFLVLIFECKKKKNDTLVTQFITFMTTHLNNFAIFETLISKTK